jgi:hypothetical protein
MLTVNALRTVLDSLAAEVPLVDAALGIDGVTPGTVAYGAAQNVATLVATGDADVQGDLVGVFRSRAGVVVSPSLLLGLGGRFLHRALDVHFLRGAGGLNQQLAAYGLRVHPHLRRLGFTLDASNVFVAPAIDPLATFVVTGAGAGNFVNVATIDETQYAPAALALVTTSGIGGQALVVTLTLRNSNGGASQQIVNIPANAANGTVIAVPGTHLGVTAIALVGGTAGDAFKITAPEERAIAL